jgi:hypothetical protein
MGGYSNPFDAPLQSELQEHQQAQVATQQASPINNPFDEPLLSEKAEAAATGSDTGQVTNDVGNAVIMPKEGESFDDTMKRAAAYGKTVTPAQINAETATAPKKVAQTLLAAPAIGAAGAGAISGLGEGGQALYELAIRHLAGVLPELEGSDELAKQKLLEMAPKILNTVKNLGIAGGGIGLLLKAIKYTNEK